MLRSPKYKAVKTRRSKSSFIVIRATLLAVPLVFCLHFLHLCITFTAEKVALNPEEISTRFPNCNMTDVTSTHGAVYLLNCGAQQSVVKTYLNDARFRHSLYIQQQIEDSKYRDITVSMLNFDPQQRWIQFEAGIPIKGEQHTILSDISDWKEQIMNHQSALSSLGIIHNDVYPGNFLLSKSNPRRLLIFDFGNSLMPYDYHLWFNRWHAGRAYQRGTKVWRGDKEAFHSFFNDITEYKRTLRIFMEK